MQGLDDRVYYSSGLWIETTFVSGNKLKNMLSCYLITFASGAATSIIALSQA